MKDSSKSIKYGSNGDDDARRLKRKSKKRRRDRSLSYSSSDSDGAFTERKRRRKEAKRKKTRGSGGDDDSTLRRKGRKKSRKSKGEYRKKLSRVKQNRKAKKTRPRNDSSDSSTSDCSSSESCSTCRGSYSSDGESWYRRSKREEFVKKGGSKRGELKKESWKVSGREGDKHSSRSSPSCSGCRVGRAEVTDDVRTLVRKGIGDQRTDNEGFVVARFYEDGVSGEDDKCQANHENGAEDATQGKYIDESQRWEMGADNDMLFGDSSSMMKLNPERDPENVDSANAPNIMHDGRDCSTKSHQYEILSDHCEGGDEVGTSIDVNNSEEGDLEAILRQKALENLKRFQDKQPGKGGHTLSMAKTVDEGIHRTSSIRAGSIPEGIADGMLEMGHTIGIPGVEDGDGTNGNTLSNYPDSSRARSIVSPIRISTVCNNDENNKHSNVTEAKKAGGASDNKNSTIEQNFSQKVPHLAAVSKGTSATMLRERETLRKESIVKPASTSVSRVVHDVEANDTDGVPSVASGGSGSVKSNIGQTESKSMTTEASQYEQKTMSVMRGGEMVQVSYKVYIPKRAPALARRQLRR